MEIRNKTTIDRGVPVDGEEIIVPAGGTAEVPDEIANGTPPVGDPDDPNYYPGVAGLLAQTDVWEQTGGKKAPPVDKPTPSVEEEKV